MFNKESDLSKKGDYGEFVVNCLLQERGYQLHVPQPTLSGVEKYRDDAHLFDGMARLRKYIGKDVFYYDVKTKPKLMHYDGTGVDKSQLEHYKSLSEELEFKIIFVDKETKSIYGNTIVELMKPYHNENEEHKKNGGDYPFEMQGIDENTREFCTLIIFSMKNMKRLGTIGEEDLKKLQ